MMKKGLGILSGILLMNVVGALPVQADECNWVEGYWDDAAQVWHDGYCAAYTDAASTTWTDTSTSDPVWMQYYSQSNPTWSGTVVGDYGTMAENGCVPTSGAMMLSHFGYSVSPVDLAWQMYGWGDYNSWMGHGAGGSAIANMAYNYGLNCWGCYSYDDAKSALVGGAVIAAIIYYGGGTHCVVLTGFDSNGNTTVYDPKGGTYKKSLSAVFDNRSWVELDCTGCGNFTAVNWW